MADGYRIIGAEIFPLQGHSAPMDFAKRGQQARSRAYPRPRGLPGGIACL